MCVVSRKTSIIFLLIETNRFLIILKRVKKCHCEARIGKKLRVLRKNQKKKKCGSFFRTRPSFCFCHTSHSNFPFAIIMYSLILSAVKSCQNNLQISLG